MLCSFQLQMGSREQQASRGGTKTSVRWQAVRSPAVCSQVGRDCQGVHPHGAGDVARARPGDGDAHDAKDTMLGIVGGQAQE